MASQEEEGGDQQRPVRHLLLLAAPQLGTLILSNYMFAQAAQITVGLVTDRYTYRNHKH